ncbi:MAG: GGDEF domain-containing protein [Gammaproteobacteria bacterium]|nr:GGDEF domain-containing protein [Gammaproteobacteria bacterium]
MPNILLIEDEVLLQLSQLLKKQLRGEDILCRFGGEEFIIALPEIDLEAVKARAETLREAVSKKGMEYQGKNLSNITISLGLVLFPEGGANIQALVHAADQALYQAKKEGYRFNVTPQSPQKK